MNKTNTSPLQAWSESRSGAWAGGGFHYQYLVSTLILVRQWAGVAPAGYLVPEGLEDCVLELANHRIWVQVKSRKPRRFSTNEVEEIFSSINEKGAGLNGDAPTGSVFITNRKCSGITEQSMESLFEDELRNVIVCSDPDKEIVDLLSKNLDTAQIIAEGIASDLYKYVAEASSENASLSYDERHRISTTEVEHRIAERLHATDPTAVNHALVSGVVRTIDLQTPVVEPSFYLGVKTKPGHVAAGLVFPRMDEVTDVEIKLKTKRYVLLTGPSGVGKSALLWLLVDSLAVSFRWFQISSMATASDVDSVVRFVNARRPSAISPIGLAVDEVGEVNATMWGVLVTELRGLPNVYLIGTVRTEDLYLVANRADIECVQVILDAHLAESVWTELASRNETHWVHWQEPFEQSVGLMLEYVHILTQGERLSEQIGDQIRQRETEERADELAIIRCTSELCRHGGEVDIQRLVKQLNMLPEQCSAALKRLVDEHLVRESSPGVLGGLHSLRTEALCKASHDELIYIRSSSLWLGLPAVTNKALPRVIQSLLSDKDLNDTELKLRKFAELLASSNNVETWTAVLTGLGLASLENNVALFINKLKKYEVQKAHWSLASMFVVAGTDVPDMPKFVHWKGIKDAVESFRAKVNTDLRNECLAFLPIETMAPSCENFEEAIHLLSATVPITGGEAVDIGIRGSFTQQGEQDIEQVAAFLQTSALINQRQTEDFVEAFGGEDILLKWFHRQTPWIGVPVVEQGDHGRTVRADYFLVSEEEPENTNDTIVGICEKLIALSPKSDAAASSLVKPNGEIVKFGDYEIASKNMPRENIPAKSEVAWNIAFRQIMLTHAADLSLTSYTQRMSALLTKTEKCFRSYSEKWIRGKRIASGDQLAVEMYTVTEEVNSLVYVEPGKASTSMTTPDKSDRSDDSIGSLFTGVLGNLVPRMNEETSQGGYRGMATFAGSLANQAHQQLESSIWRTTSSPPIEKIAQLADRLKDVGFILHETAHNSSDAALTRRKVLAKKAPRGKVIRSVARRCSEQSNKRFRKKLDGLVSTLEKQNCRITCWTRPTSDMDSTYWPPLEIAIGVGLQDFEEYAYDLEATLAASKEMLGTDWRFTVVPLFDGVVLADLAIEPMFECLTGNSSSLPAQNFTVEWQNYIDLPFHVSEIASGFDRAMNACSVLSAVLNCRSLNELLPREQEVAENCIKDYNAAQELLGQAVKQSSLEIFEFAADMANETWNEVVDELNTVDKGNAVFNPIYDRFYKALNGENCEFISEMAGVRVLLREAEIRMRHEN